WSSSMMATRVSRGFALIKISRFMWIGREHRPRRLLGSSTAMEKSWCGTVRPGAQAVATFQVRGLLHVVRDRARCVRPMYDAVSALGPDWLRGVGGRLQQ